MIIPLHFGALAPSNHFSSVRQASFRSPSLTQLLDGGAITNYFFGLDRPMPSGPQTHSFVAALLIASIAVKFFVRQVSDYERRSI